MKRHINRRTRKNFVKESPVSIVVVLHNIRSIHNVGSIFRTADAAGIEKIYLCGITPAPLDRFGKVRPQFAKVALGAEEYIEWEAATRSPQAVAVLLKNLKGDGYKIFAVEQAKGSVPYYKAKTNSSRASRGRAAKPKKIVLVLGDEVRGLPASILKRADKILEIPILGGKESLNVSVAFGIVAFGLRY